MKDNKGDRKTADTVTRAQVVLDVERAPDTERKANPRKSAKRQPTRFAGALTTQTMDERNERPTAQ